MMWAIAPRRGRDRGRPGRLESGCENVEAGPGHEIMREVGACVRRPRGCGGWRMGAALVGCPPPALTRGDTTTPTGTSTISWGTSTFPDPGRVAHGSDLVCPSTTGPPNDMGLE